MVHACTCNSQEKERKEREAEVSRKKEQKKAELAQKYACFFFTFKTALYMYNT